MAKFWVLGKLVLNRRVLSVQKRRKIFHCLDFVIPTASGKRNYLCYQSPIAELSFFSGLS